jgi:hypothetical protein
MSSRLTLCVTSLVWLAVNASSSFALSPCPPQDERLANAKTVIEARVKSFSISPSGLLFQEGFPAQIIKASLEVERVITGELKEKEVVVYGFGHPPSPFRELAIMALFYSPQTAETHETEDIKDTFEWELEQSDLVDSQVAYYGMNGCNYYKFPDFATPQGDD